MSNIIQFPQTKSIYQPNEVSPTFPQAFYLNDKVRLANGDEGFVYEGKPNFGLKKRWLYYILITKGDRPGSARACFDHDMTLIERSAA